jgi:hypothetical protein
MEERSRPERGTTHVIHDAISYPTSGDDWPIKIGILAGLSLFSWLIVPIFLVAGYYVRILETTAEGGSELPEWSDWGDLFVDGLKLVAVAVAYMLVPIVVAAISFFLLRDVSVALAGLLVFVVTATFYYLLPASLANHAAVGTLAAGFDVGTLARVLTSVEYAMAWLLALGIMVIGGIVAAIVSLVPILGWIAGPVIAATVYVAALHVYGIGYRNAVGGSAVL